LPKLRAFIDHVKRYSNAAKPGRDRELNATAQGGLIRRNKAQLA
jgi:hypothetical protein